MEFLTCLAVKDDGRRIGVFFRLTSVIGVVESPTKATKADERTFVAGSLGKYADETRVPVFFTPLNHSVPVPRLT